MTVIEEYINSQGEKQQEILRKIRRFVKELCPEATEEMGYGVPMFKLNGKPLIYYAGFAHHVSIYPANDEMVEQKIPELKKYRGGKGTFKFPIECEIPYDLVRKFVIFRINSLSIQPSLE